MKFPIFRSLLTLLIVSLITSCTSPKTEAKVEYSALKTVNLVEGRYNVAFLIMDGVYNTEFTAPYDIFQHTQYREGIRAMNVFSVANTHEPIRTFEGLSVQPDFNYLTDSLPPIDILVVPSAEHHLDTDLKDTLMLTFVKAVAEQAEYVTSHCDGAFVLAAAGLLDGKVATTFPADVEAFAKRFEQVDVRDSVLFVHDGKYITSVGGAKSFEAALYLSEHLYGAEVARRLAKGLVIDWKLDQIPYTVVNAANKEVAQMD